VRRLSRRDRMVLICSLGTLAALALVFGVALPMREASARVGTEVAQLRQKIAEAEDMYAQAAAVRQEVAKLRGRVKRLSRPDKGVSANMIRQMDELTGDLGVRLINVRPGQPQRAGACRKHTASFEVESDLRALARLLWEIEQPPNPMWVEGLEISSEVGGGRAMRTTLNVAVYSVPTRAVGDESPRRPAAPSVSAQTPRGRAGPSPPAPGKLSHPNE